MWTLSSMFLQYFFGWASLSRESGGQSSLYVCFLLYWWPLVWTLTCDVLNYPSRSDFITLAHCTVINMKHLTHIFICPAWYCTNIPFIQLITLSALYTSERQCFIDSIWLHYSFITVWSLVSQHSQTNWSSRFQQNGLVRVTWSSSNTVIFLFLSVVLYYQDFYVNSGYITRITEQNVTLKGQSTQKRLFFYLLTLYVI